MGATIIENWRGGSDFFLATSKVYVVTERCDCRFTILYQIKEGLLIYNQHENINY